MPTHVVQPGECFLRIGAAYGFHWKTLWEAPENADLKAKRGNPNILLPGDRVVIPELTARQESGATERVHSFRARNRTRFLRLRLQDPQGKPLAGQTVTLRVRAPGADADRSEVVKTDGDGVLECRVPVDASEAELVVGDVSWALRLGSLAPRDTVEGLQGRLNSLNYDAGPIDGVMGPRTRDALRGFQRDHDLAVDGVYGPESQAKLEEVHGC